MMVERCVSHSVYIDQTGVPKDVVVFNKPPIRFYDPSFPYEGRLERLDYRVLLGIDGKSASVPVGLFGGLHPPEHMAADIARREFSTSTISRVEAWNVHILGSVFGERRGYVRPLAPHEGLWQFPKQARIQIHDGMRVKSGGVMGIKVDLNRQFTIPFDAATWEDVLAGVTYPEARLLLFMMQQFPRMQYVFSFHEDMENGHNFILHPGTKRLARDGVYWYDMCQDARCDADRELVERLRWNLARALTASGYPLFHGVDDLRDPSLGFSADHGYINQPVVDQKGAWYLDGTFESGVVDLGRRGLLGVKRAFSFEIPGRYPRADKERVVHLFHTHLITPFLRAKGI